MSSNPSPENMASGNTADPGTAPRQVGQRADGTDVEFVSFSPGDPENPRNWPAWRKWSIVIAITLIDLSVSFTASGFSPASKKFAEDFGVSGEVGTLGLSLCVLGFALGPMTLAPLSEYEFTLPFNPSSDGPRSHQEQIRTGITDDLLFTSPRTVFSFFLYSVLLLSIIWVAFSSCDSCRDGSVL